MSTSEQPNTGGGARRSFGSPLMFVSEGGGRWVFEGDGHTFTIERRRGEPGAPAGWYYFGPGTEHGVLVGEAPADAAERAYDEWEKVHMRAVAALAAARATEEGERGA